MLKKSKRYRSSKMNNYTYTDFINQTRIEKYLHFKENIYSI